MSCTIKSYLEKHIMGMKKNGHTGNRETKTTWFFRNSKIVAGNYACCCNFFHITFTFLTWDSVICLDFFFQTTQFYMQMMHKYFSEKKCRCLEKASKDDGSSLTVIVHVLKWTTLIRTAVLVSVMLLNIRGTYVGFHVTTFKLTAPLHLW